MNLLLTFIIIYYYYYCCCCCFIRWLGLYVYARRSSAQPVAPTISSCIHCIKPRLHQGNMLPGIMLPGRATCCRQHSLYVDGSMLLGNKLLVRDTCWLYLGNIIIITIIYVTVDLYSFVSSSRRATNWQQFCCRYRPTSNMLPGNMLPWCKRGFTVVVYHTTKAAL